jgi:hypothetical protein
VEGSEWGVGGVGGHQRVGRSKDAFLFELDVEEAVGVGVLLVE